jgi:diguanylate cyclase (GGDEF)-like protein/PAS domain S-box-containing protein
MAGNRVPFWRSIRTKLVVVSIAVEVVMLGLLLANSFRLLNRTLQEQTHARLVALTPLLNASLSDRLFERDHASIREILDELVRGRQADLSYIVVYDNRNAVYASAGGIDTGAMPALDVDVANSLKDLTYDAHAPLTVGSTAVGSVRFGLSLTALAASRDKILRQGTLIAGAEVLLSFLLLAGAGYLLTRHIRHLVEATRKISAGDYAIHVPVQGRDEIRMLGDNFNHMSMAVRERVEALRESERALHEEKERAEVTLHSIGDGVITADVEGYVRYMNPVAEKLTGHTLKAARCLVIEKIYHVVDEQTGSSLANPVRLCLADNAVTSGIVPAQLVSASGEIHSIEETASPIRDRDGNTVGAVLVVRDVTASREIARRLEYQATHDMLTGLINRRQFERLVEHAIQDARSEGRTHAMCYMDLDQFKVVNDTCGHASGDQLLVELTRIIRGKTREKDVVGRLGGDEFGLLLYDVNLDQAAFYAAEIRNSIRDFRYRVNGHSFEVGVSIGVVAIRQDSGALAEVFTAADVACYVAKDKGRNEIYLSQLNDVEQARRQLEMQWSARIPPALQEDRFVLHHQKVLPLRDDPELLPRCELLVRMVETDGSLIPPGKLIPAAERFRQMPEIDRWVIRHALGLIAARGENPEFAAYAINLSGQSLGQPDLLDYVKREILRSGVRPQRLTFEITETAAIQNISHAAHFMAELKKMGCQFALDDFGSGLSSFGYLKMLPVDYLKIDGSFVRNMLLDTHDHSIVVAIAQIGKTLGIRCVAEFVGDRDTVAALKEIGVDYGQGFYLHKPEPLAVQRAAGGMTQTQ